MQNKPETKTESRQPALSAAPQGSTGSGSPLSKLIAIAWKDIFLTFQDRNALIMMFAAPLGLSLIIGLAFGGGGDISIAEVPLAVINRDQGATPDQGDPVNLGQTYVDAFVPPDEGAADSPYAQIYALTDGQSGTDAEAARQQVQDGDLAAVIEIPANFSEQALAEGGSGTIDIYFDSGLSVGPSVVVSITRAISNGMNAVILAQRVGPGAMSMLGQQSGADEDTINAAIEQFMARSGEVSTAQTIAVSNVNLQGETRVFDALQYFAPSMAILFMTFAMAGGATGVLEEQRDWTMQRIITTPTPRWVFMAGKLVGIYATGLLQMLMLIVATILVAMLMGRETAVWGSNLPGIVLLVLTVVFAGSGLGLVIAAMSQTPEQTSAYASAVLFVSAMLGGSFVTMPDFLLPLSRLTLNYWGIDGFIEMNINDGGLGDILINLGALLAMGAVFFSFSLWRFSRRLDV